MRRGRWRGSARSTAARELATAPRAVRVLRGADGAELARLPVEGAERRWGAPYLAIHRVDLHRVLAEAAAATGKVALHFGAEVAGVASEAGSRLDRPRARRGRARARPAKRSSAPTGCARWCARASAAARPMRRAFPAGWRSAPRSRPNGSRRAGATNEVTLRLGPRAHLVHYPLRGGSIVNLVAVIESSWRGAKVANEATIPGTARPTGRRSTAPFATGRATRAI